MGLVLLDGTEIPIGGFINDEGFINKADVSNAFNTFGKDTVMFDKSGEEIKRMLTIKKMRLEERKDMHRAKIAVYMKELKDQGIDPVSVGGEYYGSDYPNYEPWNEKHSYTDEQRKMMQKLEECFYKCYGIKQDLKTIDTMMLNLEDGKKYKLNVRQMQALEKAIGADSFAAMMDKGGNAKVEKVMREFKEGKLTSHGKKVTDRDQAIAIAMSEAGISKEHKPDMMKFISQYTGNLDVAGEAAKNKEKEEQDALSKAWSLIDGDIEKGIYANNAENRRKGRVGMPYGDGSHKLPNASQKQEVQYLAKMLLKERRYSKQSTNKYDKQQSDEKVADLTERLNKRLPKTHQITDKHGEIGVTDVSVWDVVDAWRKGKPMPKPDKVQKAEDEDTLFKAWAEFDEDIEKGTYKNNPENRRKGRVGQKYGERKEQGQSLESYMSSIKYPRVHNIEGVSMNGDIYVAMRKHIDSDPEMKRNYTRIVNNAIDGLMSRSFNANQLKRDVKSAKLNEGEGLWNAMAQAGSLDVSNLTETHKDMAAQFVVAGILGDFETDTSSFDKYLKPSLKKEVKDYELSRGKRKVAQMLGGSKMVKGDTEDNLFKAWDEIEKGTYVNNAENRKKGRVGHQYGGKSDKVEFLTDQDMKTKRYSFEREKGSVGSFGWKHGSKYNEGYLLPLDSYDKGLIKDLKLKEGEKVYRYTNDKTKIGKMTPMIKINTNSGNLYFLNEKSQETGDIEFETKGVKAEYVKIAPKSEFEAPADGKKKEEMEAKKYGEEADKKNAARRKEAAEEEMLNEIAKKTGVSRDKIDDWVWDNDVEDITSVHSALINEKITANQLKEKITGGKKEGEAKKHVSRKEVKNLIESFNNTGIKKFEGGMLEFVASKSAKEGIARELKKMGFANEIEHVKTETTGEAPVHHFKVSMSQIGSKVDTKKGLPFPAIQKAEVDNALNELIG